MADIDHIENGEGGASVRGKLNDVIDIANDAVQGDGITNIVALTQAQYDALTEPDETTLYVIVEDE